MENEIKMIDILKIMSKENVQKDVKDMFIYLLQLIDNLEEKINNSNVESTPTSEDKIDDLFLS